MKPTGTFRQTRSEILAGNEQVFPRVNDFRRKWKLDRSNYRTFAYDVSIDWLELSGQTRACLFVFAGSHHGGHERSRLVSHMISSYWDVRCCSNQLCVRFALV